MIRPLHSNVAIRALMPLVATALLAACDDSLGSTEWVDAGGTPASDAGAGDVSVNDAAASDAGASDAGAADASPDASPDTGADVSFGDVAPDTPPAHQPRVGLWTYVDEGLRDNSCGEYAFTDDDQRFWIEASSDGAFVISQGEPWGDIACRIAGDRFACPERGTGEVPIDNTDAVLTYRVAVEGTLDGDAAMHGEQRVTVTCDGASCAFAPSVLGITFPCGWSAAFSATSP